jgi:starch phosphorylase
MKRRPNSGQVKIKMTTRTVREYVEQHYLHAAASYRRRIANKGDMGRQIVDWTHNLEEKWATLRFGNVRIETRDGQHIFEVEVSLNDLDPAAVRVELCADGFIGGSPIRQEMKRTRPLDDASRIYVYEGAVPSARPAGDYSARLVPQFDGVAVPLESARILWQR